MDLSGFKKVSSDKDHSTFKHPDGHTIKVSHASLSPKDRAALHKLPTQKLAEGGGVKPQPTPQPPVNPQDASNIRKAFVGYADGGEVQQEPGLEQDRPGLLQMLSNGAGYLTGGAVGTDQSQPPADASPQVPVPSQDHDYPAPSQDQQPQGDVFGTDAMSKAYTQGLSEQKQGIRGEAAAVGQQGQAEAKIAGDNAESLQKQQQAYQQHYTDLDNERQGFMSDLAKRHIDPNHYLGSMDTAKKISTGIGLILGGIGGGLTGQENPVMKFVNQQIDRDIEAQKASLQTKESLLSANMRQFGNLRDATDMTKVMMMDATKLKLQQAAAQAMDPQAKARAMQSIGKLDSDSAGFMGQLAARKALSQTSGNNPEAMIRAFVPQAQQEKAADSLSKVREVDALSTELHKSFTDIHSKTLNGTFSPNDTASAKNLLAGKLSKATAGRFNMEEAKNQVDSILPGKTDSDSTVANKMNRLDSLMDIERKAEESKLSMYGISVPRPKFAKPNLNAPKR